MQDQTAISQRRACCLVGLSRSVLSYRSKKQRSDARLQGRLRELAAERKRFGYRRLHVLLRREGYVVNHKKVYRLYREADLAVRRRKRRRGLAVARQPLQLPSGEDSIAEKRARGWGGPYMRYTARTPRLFRLLPAGTTVARWASHSLRERAF